MLWQSQPWPPRRSRRRSRMRARTRRKPYMGMPAPEGERGREEERNAQREGRSSIASVREQASKRAMGGRRSKIPNSRYRVGGYVGAQITIKRLHVAWAAHPVAVMPAVHSIIRHVSPLPRCLCRRSKPVPKSRRKKINNIILSASLPPLRTFLLPLPKSLN